MPFETFDLVRHCKQPNLTEIRDYEIEVAMVSGGGMDSSNFIPCGHRAD